MCQGRQTPCTLLIIDATNAGKVKLRLLIHITDVPGLPSTACVNFKLYVLFRQLVTLKDLSSLLSVTLEQVFP